MLQLAMAFMALMLNSAQVPTPDAGQLIWLEDTTAKSVLMFQARPTPYTVGTKATASLYIRDRKDARDRDGLIVSGLAFYAWPDGSDLRVRVFELVPGAGQPNKYSANSLTEISRLVPKPLSEYRLHMNARVEIVELKALGLSRLWLRRSK